MADTIEKVQVEVEATAKGVSTVFKQLESQLGTIQKAMASIDTSKLNAVAKNINTSGMSKAERDISSSVDKIKQSLAGLKSYKDAALGGDSSSLTSLQRRIVSIQSAIDVLGEKLRQVGDNRTGINIDTEQFQEYRRQLAEMQAMLEQTKDEAKNAAEEMSKEKPDVDTKSISEKLSGIKENAISALKAIKKVASGIGSAFVSAGKGLKSITARMLGVSGGLGKTSSSFKHGLRTLIKYGFGVRSLYVLFRRLRKAVVESFGELQKSGAMWQTTKENVEGLKNALSTLKFQFGAAFEPLFNFVAPALTSFINYLISLMNTISAFIAKLTGRSTYSKVAQVMSNTGGAAGSAGKAVKELNKQLQNFDELNNISPENNSGGGGGGGGGGTGTSATYTEESVDSALGDFANSLAEAIEKGDWYKVGNLISQKLTDAMNSIDWDKVFAGAKNFGKNLADFLNGLITPDLFSALGTTIGNAIKAKLIFLNTLGEELDWENLADSIASGLKAFVDTHPLPLLANTFNTWAKKITGALARTIRNLLDNGTIQTISNDITEAISKIELGEIAWNIGSFISGLVNSIYVIVSNKETWKELGKKIGDGINGFFTSMNQVDPKTGLTGWGALAQDVSSLATGLLEMITKAVETIEWDEVGKAIADFISNIDWGRVIIDLGKLALAIASAIASALIGLVTNGDVTTNIGAAILTLIGAAKLLNLGSKLTTIISGALGSEFKSNIPTKLILGFAGLELLINSDEIGTAIGKKIAQAFGDDELVEYYDEYNTWGKIFERLKSDFTSYVLDLTSYTTVSLDVFKKGFDLWWKKYFTLTDDVERALDKYYKDLKTVFSNFANKVQNLAFEEKNGIKLQKNVNYEFDDKGGIRYAYKDNKDNNKTIIDLKINLEALYNKGFISKKDFEKFTEYIEKFKKFANKSGINIKSKFDMIGDIDSMDDFKKFMQMMNVVNDFSGIYESQYNIDVGGDVDNTDDIDKLGGSMNNLRKGWNGKDAKMTVNTSVSGYGNGTQGLSSLANDFKTKLLAKWNGKDAKMTTSYDTTRNSKALSDLDALATEWSKKSASANFTVTTENMSGWQSWSSYRALCDLYNNWYGTDAKFGVQFDVSGAPNIQKAFRDLTADINAKLNAAGVPGTVSVPNIQTATGGVVTSAQLRMVGEAGAEAIVPLQNNLGWLGKMSDMLVSGMEQSSTLGSFVSPPNTRFATYESTGYGSNSSDYLLTELVRETARQNDILEQILDKPSGITSSEVFRAVRTEGRSFKTRTGNSPFNY
jgi:hypothetical protein